MNAQVAEIQQEQQPTYQMAINSSASHFEAAGTGLVFEKERVFAVNQLMKNNFSMDTARNNPTSVKVAMFNVASIGLTLNPANGYAYLIPRDRAIVVDISYKGMIKVATDTGAIMWARADLVYANDTFHYMGPAKAPVHEANPFKDRGDIVGCYCIAKTRDGDILTEIMTLEELHKIRGKSTAYTKSKSGPWVEWFSEMCRKAVIKRASKTWPYTERTDKVFQAIEIANEAEGGYEVDMAHEAVTEDQAVKLGEWLESTGVDSALLLEAFKVDTISAIPRYRYNEAVALIQAKAAP